MVDLTADLRTQLWTATQAAEAAAVSPHVVRNWKYRGVLDQARDDAGQPVVDRHGRPLFRAIDVIRAEKATREKARRVYMPQAA
ncbi:MerR family transcriptional regulator [Streptomyces sp. NPDC052000]|uniref:MerR family transcriptional regulator n=1 Tax=Streptomyces sp. NPDC052000 TaxID=3155676 RepID=UPI00344D2827